MRGLYAIVDVVTASRRRLSVVEVAAAVARAEPAALQLRAKEVTPRETLALLRAIRPLCRARGVPLFANDRPDLAALAGCDGVHLGQDDLPIEVARRFAPALRVGVSTHTPAQFERALRQRADYIAFGPIFGTRSKEDPDEVVGIDALAQVASRSPIPVVAIGGIDLGRAPAVGRITGVGAVIAALFPDESGPVELAAITERARALHGALATVDKEEASPPRRADLPRGIDR